MSSVTCRDPFGNQPSQHAVAFDSLHNSWIFACDSASDKSLLATCSSSPFWTNHHTAITITATNRELMSHKQLWSWPEQPVKGSDFAASHFFTSTSPFISPSAGQDVSSTLRCASSAHSLWFGADGSSTLSIHFLVSPPFIYPAQLALTLFRLSLRQQHLYLSCTLL